MTYSSSKFEIQTQELLNLIQGEIDYQLKKEITLDKGILEQMELATARHTNGNKFGAILCMNNIARIRLEREQVNSTIATLETHVMRIEKRLVGGARRQTPNNMQRSGSEISFDLTAHTCSSTQVASLEEDFDDYASFY